MANITKYNNLTNKIPPKVYTIWDIGKEVFFRPISNTCKLLPGIWSSKEDAVYDAKNIKDYKVLEINMLKNLPEDLLIILEDPEMRNDISLIKSKMRQLFNVFVFNNENLIRQLKSEKRR